MNSFQEGFIFCGRFMPDEYFSKSTQALGGAVVPHRAGAAGCVAEAATGSEPACATTAWQPSERGVQTDTPAAGNVSYQRSSDFERLQGPNTIGNVFIKKARNLDGAGLFM